MSVTGQISLARPDEEVQLYFKVSDLPDVINQANAGDHITLHPGDFRGFSDSLDLDVGIYVTALPGARIDYSKVPSGSKEFISDLNKLSGIDDFLFLLDDLADATDSAAEGQTLRYDATNDRLEYSDDLVVKSSKVTVDTDLEITGSLTTTGGFSTLAVGDLTDGRVITAGSGGELEDSTNLTFDGTTLTASALTVQNASDLGNLKIDTNTISSTNTDGDIIVSPDGSGIFDINSNLDIQGTLGFSSGTTVNSIQTSTTLGSPASNDVLPTQAAVKTYVDNTEADLIDGTTDFTGISVTGGSIDGTTIGATTAAAATLTNVTVNGNFSFDAGTSTDVIYNSALANAATYIVASSLDGTAKRIDSDGNQTLNISLGTRIEGLAVDSNGNIYTGDDNGDVKKFDSDGNLQWTFTGHGTSRVRTVAVEADGSYVYSGSIDDNSVRKIDSSGNQVWAFTDTSTSTGFIQVQNVEIDENGNVYVGSASFGGHNTITKLDSDGNRVWGNSDIGFGAANDVAVESDGSFVYAAGEDNNVRKLDSSGTTVWAAPLSNDVQGVDFDSDGNVYAASDDQTLRKFDSSGNELWSFTGFGSFVKDVEVDGNGDIYAGGSDDTFRKIDSGGSEVWSFTGFTDTVFGMDTFVTSGSASATALLTENAIINYISNNTLSGSANTTDDLPEGSSNLYYTDTRVSNNSDVSANTSARHTQGTDTGTTSQTFAVDSDAGSHVLLKNVSGELYLRDQGDSNDANLVVGNLTVNGTTTTINSTTVTIDDNTLVLNENVTGSPSQDAGILIERGTSTNASILWDESNDVWKLGLEGSEEELAYVTTNVSTFTNDAGYLTSSDTISADQIKGVTVDDSNISDTYILQYNNSSGNLEYVSTASSGYSSSDFDTDFSNKTTDDLSEGSNNLYYTDARAIAAVEGTATLALGGNLTTGGYIQATGTVDAGVDVKAGDAVIIGGGSQSQALTINNGGNAFVDGFIVANGTIDAGVDLKAGADAEITGDVNAGGWLRSNTGLMLQNSGTDEFKLEAKGATEKLAILQATDNPSSTLLNLRSPFTSAINTDDREATLALQISSSDESDSITLDVYNNRYNGNVEDWAVASGLRLVKNGTATYPKFMIDWYDGSTQTKAVEIMSPDQAGGPELISHVGSVFNETLEVGDTSIGGPSSQLVAYEDDPSTNAGRAFSANHVYTGGATANDIETSRSRADFDGTGNHTGQWVLSQTIESFNSSANTVDALVGSRYVVQNKGGSTANRIDALRLEARNINSGSSAGTITGLTFRFMGSTNSSNAPTSFRAIEFPSGEFFNTGSDAYSIYDNSGLDAYFSANVTVDGDVTTTDGVIGTMAVRDVYISTSGPSGGNDGDVWLQY